jgi:hypothetical protein
MIQIHVFLSLSPAFSSNARDFCEKCCWMNSTNTLFLNGDELEDDDDDEGDLVEGV